MTDDRHHFTYGEDSIWPILMWKTSKLGSRAMPQPAAFFFPSFSSISETGADIPKRAEDALMV